MRHLRGMFFVALFGLLPAAAAADQPKAILVIHGGAGTPARREMSEEREREYRADLENALKVGHEILHRGGTSLDAVEAVIKLLEDSPRFNAGRGAVFTRDGRNELDASIMDGKDRRAGAVAGVTRVKNPITAARAVMEKSEHVLMVGDGAEKFVFGHGVVEVSPRYFWTEQRWRELQNAERRAEQRSGGGAAPADEGHFGTVGAVAVDQKGNIAAGTSTGGMTFKRTGRLGDSPIIGAGTFADNATCGASCTGHGEVFIKYAVASDIAARMRYKKLGVAAAAAEVFAELPKEDGGVGGAIALDRDGNFATPYNTAGMFRGHVTADGKTTVAILER